LDSLGFAQGKTLCTVWFWTARISFASSLHPIMRQTRALSWILACLGFTLCRTCGTMYLGCEYFKNMPTNQKTVNDGNCNQTLLENPWFIDDFPLDPPVIRDFPASHVWKSPGLLCFAKTLKATDNWWVNLKKQLAVVDFPLLEGIAQDHRLGKGQSCIRVRYPDGTARATKTTVSVNEINRHQRTSVKLPFWTYQEKCKLGSHDQAPKQLSLEKTAEQHSSAGPKLQLM